MARKSIIWFTLPFVLLLDRVSKAFILARYHEGEGVVVAPPFFSITRVNNRGAAFGIMDGHRGFLVFLAIACIAWLVAYLGSVPLAKRKSPVPSAGAAFLATLGYGLILAGAIGNLMDRLRLGYVVDFLDFHVWPVFNVADTSICVGVFLAGFELLSLWMGKRAH